MQYQCVKLKCPENSNFAVTISLVVLTSVFSVLILSSRLYIGYIMYVPVFVCMYT